MFDVIIKGGQVLDGTGAPLSSKDIGIKGDSIAAVGNLSGAKPPEPVDATGQVSSTTPGFIDMHNHFDQTVLTVHAAQA